jgi:hypothetical protein
MFVIFFMIVSRLVHSDVGYGLYSEIKCLDGYTRVTGLESILIYWPINSPFSLSIYNS